ARRRGLTLVEMLLAISILGITAGTLTGLSLAVQQGTTYSQGYSTATQHARVTLERIARTVGQATATDAYPGAVVVYDMLGSWRFPDTLVVWRPNGPPANPLGPPLLGEVVVYCPDPANPNQLLEVTAPGDTTPVPLNDAGLNTPAWRSQIKSLACAATSNKVLLTNLLRAAQYDPSTVRAAIRFETDLHPTAAEWSACQTSPALWNTLGWPQGLGGSQAGLRQAAVRVELQLLPPAWAGQLDPQAQQTVPFLGSAAFSYALQHP
ncbi:MAG TPA: prepilin-type N-terminal cleavage/methylation domain-containing protein, partial [Pirellulales bacterium]|nr:prepilin-type N-terminal cleavage/methylation domain-containing protein [Pirellulales bacterium]